MRRGSIIPATRALQPPPYYYDGIHLDFRYGAGALGCYVKAAGAAPTIAPLTTLFTFTGGNQSMYMGPAGLLVQSVTDTPRIEYDTNGNCLGLLMEAARTNLGLHSNDHTNAAWAKTNMTTAKTSTGPDGVTNSATRLTASAGNATSIQTVVSTSATRAYSVWMRRITGTGNIDMTLDGGTGWTTKTLTTSWARFDITQAAVTNPAFGIRIVTSGDAIDVYGNQMESAAFPSSLITTTTGSVARTADSCIRTLGSEFSATAGTVVVQGRASGGQAGRQVFCAFSDGSVANTIPLVRPGVSDFLQLRIEAASVNQTAMGAAMTNSAAFKAAAVWAANDADLYFNGVATTPDAVVTLPAGITTLGMGCEFTSSSPCNGHIRRFDYYPTRLPNGFLTTA